MTQFLNFKPHILFMYGKSDRPTAVLSHIYSIVEEFYHVRKERSQ
ncbi:hypothetical protein [Microcoleus sp. PH2017_02_FOX_O_A]|nr:hypothetical protein [Microcoleus sp. PH2017_02_FOX_O_A]